MMRAEADAVADAKRRAADELAERARAAYANKFAAAADRHAYEANYDSGGGATSTGARGGRNSRSISRELPSSLTRAAMGASAAASVAKSVRRGSRDALSSSLTSSSMSSGGAPRVRRTSQ